MDVAALPRVIPRILALAFNQRRSRAAMAVLASVAATIFSILLPKLLGGAVDQAHHLLGAGAAHADAARQALWLTAGLIVGAASLRGLLTMVSGFQFESISQTLGYELRLAYFDRLQKLDFAWHDGVHSGDLITRGMLDLEGVRMFVENGVQRAVTLFLLLTIGAGLMLWTDPLMAALALSFVPFVAWRAVSTGLILRLTWTRLQQSMSILTRTIEENLQGVRVVRAFAAKPFEMMRFDAAADTALKMANDRIAIRTGAISTMTFAFYLAMALTLLVGGHRVAAGQMTVGHLTEFLAFMTLLQTPVRQTMMVVNTVARAVSSGSRLFEILDREPAVSDRRGAPDLHLTNGVLRFEQVGFAFESAPVLTDISFEVGPGRRSALSAHPVRASPCWRNCCRVSTTSRPDGSRSMARIFVTCPCRRCARPSLSSSRTFSCSTAAWATMSPMPSQTPMPGASRRPRVGRICMTTSQACQTVTTVPRANAASACPAASASAWPLRAASCRMPRSSCSMMRPRRSTPIPNIACAPICAACRRTGRRSSSLIVWHR